MKFVSFLSLFLFSFSAFTQTCANVNLVTEKDSPFQKIPVYDQDGIGACYAYSAAQLMDYYLLENNLKSASSVSPIWTALTYSNYIQRSTISGGSIHWAVQATRIRGFCDSLHANKVIREFAQKGGMRDEELVAVLETYYALYMKEIKSSKSFNETNLKVTTVFNPKFVEQKRKDDLFKKATRRLSAKYCPANGQFEELKDSINSFLDLPVTYTLNRFTRLNCPKPEKNIVPQSKEYSPQTDADVEKNLIQKLTEKRPAGISYCSSFWFDPTARKIISRGPAPSVQRWDGCDDHASIVVGMKPVDNKCQFLVRNTWGSGFSKATSHFKCLCKNKKTNAYVDNCTNKTHNNGQYTVEACWVPSEILSKNTYRINAIYK